MEDSVVYKFSWWSLGRLWITYKSSFLRDIFGDVWKIFMWVFEVWLFKEKFFGGSISCFLIIVFFERYLAWGAARGVVSEGRYRFCRYYYIDTSFGDLGLCRGFFCLVEFRLSFRFESSIIFVLWLFCYDFFRVLLTVFNN